MDLKIFGGIVLGVLTLFLLEQNTFAIKPVFDAANHAQLIEQLGAAREQVEHMKGQLDQLKRLSNMIQDPQARANGIMIDFTGPIGSDINQFRGLQNDMQRILNKDQSSGQLPSVSFSGVGPSSQFVRDNFFASPQKDQKFIGQNSQVEAVRRRAELQKESVVKGTALAWSEREAIDKDLKALEFLAGQIAQSQDLRTDLAISNQLKVFEIRQLVHLRTLNASLLENVSVMLLGGVE